MTENQELLSTRFNNDLITREIGEYFNEIIKRLQMISEKYNKTIDNTKINLHNLNNLQGYADYHAQIDNSDERVHNNISKTSLALNQIPSFIARIDDELKKIETSKNNLVQVTEDYMRASNNNKLKFGLRGQLKFNIENRKGNLRNLREAALADPYASHHLELPYSPTPDVPPAGGRKKTRKHKTQKRKYRK